MGQAVVLFMRSLSSCGSQKKNNQSEREMNVQFMPGIVLTTLMLFCLNVQAETTVLKQPAPRPAEIVSTVWLIGQEVVRDQWPGTLTLVNAPAQRKMALPGQCISLLGLARGEGRDALLQNSRFNFKITFQGVKQASEGLRPVGVKHIKPEGGDFVMHLLDAGGVDKREMPEMSMVSAATFEFAWCVPSQATDGTATIEGFARLPNGRQVNFTKTRLQVTSFATAVKGGDFKSTEEFGQWLMNYYKQPNPARVLAASRLLQNDNQAFTLNVRNFLVEVLKSSPQAAADLQARLANEPFAVRGYAIHLLDKAGYDQSKVIAQLPEMEQEFQRRLPPLPDPYDLRIVPDHFDTPQRMDALWSEFLATGKSRPVRAIADLLLWRDDYNALKEARASGAKGSLTAQLGRGVCYSIAGWSLGSFVRNDGLVADLVDAWKNDTTTPAVLREELRNLLSNEAFKKK